MNYKKNLIYLKKLSFLKIINFAKVYLSFLLSNIKKNATRCGMPFSISIEPTTFCNLKCPQCPVGNDTLIRPKGNISFSVFKNIIDQTYKYLINLFLYFQGEPLLNSNFSEFVKYANKKNVVTVTSTNGHFFTNENIIKIIESKLDILIVSIDGTTQDTYEKYRIKGNLDIVIAGTEKLIKLKKEMKSSTPFVELQFIVFKHNEHQINDFKKLAKKINADAWQIKTAQIYDYQKNSNLIPVNKKYSRYIFKNGNWYLKKKLKNRCKRLWFSSVITWDGNVLPCCFDKNAKYSFGNIKNEPIKKIISNNKFLKFANQVLKDRYKIDICRNCSE